MPAKPRFLEHRDSLSHNLKSATARGDHVDFHARVFLVQLSRQTGGSGLVISDRAVFDRDLHCAPDEIMLMVPGRNNRRGRAMAQLLAAKRFRGKADDSVTGNTRT